MSGPFFALLLSHLDGLAPSRTEANFLKARGWLPLGANSSTGKEGWGKMIDRHAVCVDEPEALALESWQDWPR